MTETATEPTTNVKFAALMTGLSEHAELNLKELQELAAQSDAAQQRKDYGAAIEAAQSFLAGLIKGITEELLRPPGESVDVFRARKLPDRKIGRCCRFLEHKRFLHAAEKTNIELALAAAVVPAADNGMSLETWSRIARHMVFATAGRIIARYRQWQAGCSCVGSYPVELAAFQPIDAGPPYERAICRQCRCPRKLSAATETPTAPTAVAAEPVPSVPAAPPTSTVHGGTDKPALPMELLRTPFRLVMTLLYGVRGESWRDDGFDVPLPLPQAVADLLNELRRFEWLVLPPAVEQALRGMDKRQLMAVCVWSVALLHGRVGPQRALHRLRRQRKRRRQVERRRAELVCGGGGGELEVGREQATAVVPTVGQCNVFEQSGGGKALLAGTTAASAG